MTFVYPLDALPGGPPDEVRAVVGGKAANLGVMARDLGLPAPPAGPISRRAGPTASTRSCASGWPRWRQLLGGGSAIEATRSW
jgi:hypothetical protein